MRDKTREEILREVGEQIKAMVKEFLERLMQKERALYLEKHPIKADGYYTRNVSPWRAPWRTSKSTPYIGEGVFHNKKSSPIDGACPWSLRTPYAARV